MINWTLTTAFTEERLKQHLLTKQFTRSEHLQEIIRNPVTWGLKGEYEASRYRFEHERFDSMTNTAYTEWGEESRIEYTPTISDWVEQIIDDFYSSQDFFDLEYAMDMVDAITRFLKWYGYEIHGIKPTDFFVEGTFEESDSNVSSGSGSGGFPLTGNAEDQIMNWTVSVDTLMWHDIKIPQSPKV